MTYTVPRPHTLPLVGKTMASIGNSITALKTLATQIARSSGDPAQLATQEVNAAMREGTISKAQRDVLQRALSDSGMSSLPRALMVLDGFEQAFNQADTNQDGRIQKAE